MSTKVDNARRMRTTIVVEYESQDDLIEALKHGVQCASERYLGIKFGLKGKDEHGPTIEVRTARVRRKPSTSGLSAPQRHKF